MDIMFIEIKQTQDIANYIAHECAKRAESEEYDILKRGSWKKIKKIQFSYWLF